MELPLMAAILVLGLLFYQHNQIQYRREQREFEAKSYDNIDLIELRDQFKALKKDYGETRSLLTALNLKVGMKL